MPAAWWVLWKHLPGHTLPFTTSFQHFIELLYRGTSSAFFSTVKELDFLHLSRCLAFSSIAPCRKALKSSAMVKTIFAHWKGSHFKWSWDLNMFWVQTIIQIYPNVGLFEGQCTTANHQKDFKENGTRTCNHAALVWDSFDWFSLHSNYMQLPSNYQQALVIGST